VKPALARGELRAIGATTLNEYKKYIEKDPALDAASSQSCERANRRRHHCDLRGLKERYEVHPACALRTRDSCRGHAFSSLHLDRFLRTKRLIDRRSGRELRMQMTLCRRNRRNRAPHLQLEIERGNAQGKPTRTRSSVASNRKRMRSSRKIQR